jgi:hypothetical protein
MSAPKIFAANHRFFSTSSQPFDYLGRKCDLALCREYGVITSRDGSDLPIEREDAWFQYFEVTVEIAPKTYTTFYTHGKGKCGLTEDELDEWLDFLQSDCSMTVGEADYSEGFCQWIALMIDRHLAVLEAEV